MVSNPPTPLDAAKVLRGSPLDVRTNTLDVTSLVVQAALAFRDGNPAKGLVLLGAASVAPKHRGLSILVQGVVTADDLRRRLT